MENITSLYEDLGVISYNIEVYESALEALQNQKQELLERISKKLHQEPDLPSSDQTQEDGRD